ncbi:hypothetical protein KXX57_003777 [Aspergillus fumigatus]|nr:hypothetical protein KXX57_003777 [Aspergillus fumigatus]KAH1979216.1 hypothetical protein KXW88_007425 [Aspergillus fumigatus]KAH2657821.1 hypothetical protein KXV32_001845 [Aspergillus fumigatus]KAH2910565.1 hypothetical protein KXW25_003098 [Aspergillus fumigatus]KAH3198348.1 hypothetical protein KXW62_001713 [Aspergillus fumigatus]
MGRPLSMLRNSFSIQSDRFRKNLESSRIPSALDASSFVPISELRRLVQGPMVIKILEEHGYSSISHAELAATIVQAAPRLFALLVWIGQPQLALSLGYQCLNDENLPLDDYKLESLNFRATSGWSKNWETKILQEQWIFLSPIWHREGEILSDTPPSAPLPLTFASSVRKDSANSTIRQIKIHPAHLPFYAENNDEAPILALKLFKTRGKKRFDHEISVLQLLNRRSNPNIIRLLVAISTADRRGLVFPWAQCDLSELMEQEIPSNQRKELARWILQQISLRDDSYLLADRPFDLSSSFDLCTFSLTKATLKALLGILDLEVQFLDSITSLQDDSRFSFVWKEQEAHALSYVMRTERALPSDLALAVSSIVVDSHRVTDGLIHGCTPKEAEQIIDWLRQASSSIQHPMLMALLLSEIQHERHAHLSREYWRRFNTLLSEIQTKAHLLATTPPTVPRGEARDLSEIPEWLATVFKMHHKHGVMHRYLCAFRANLGLLLRLTDQTANTRAVTDIDIAFRASATAITQRVQQISTVYMDLEQQAIVLKEGASLHLATIWSLIAQRDSQIAHRANIINQEIATTSRIIAKASGQDSSAMKADYGSGQHPISPLLPQPPSSSRVLLADLYIENEMKIPEACQSWPMTQPSIWVFVLLSATLTFLVLYAWRFWFLGMIWEKDVVAGNKAAYRVLDYLLLRRHDRRREVGVEEEDSQILKEESSIETKRAPVPVVVATARKS